MLFFWFIPVILIVVGVYLLYKAFPRQNSAK
jgi:cytochrome c-type biogenesis protein CcmH/NrfF